VPIGTAEFATPGKKRNIWIEQALINNQFIKFSDNAPVFLCNGIENRHII
jgi:hypothetical protein